MSLKKMFLLIFFFCAFLWSAERMVIGELFTSTTCPPCASADIRLDDFAKEKESYFTPICYHVWWPSPGNDPFYHYNPMENKARNTFYDNHYVPHMCIDGDTSYDASSTTWGSGIDSRKDVESPVFMSLHCNYNVEKRKGKIFVKIVNDTDTTVSGYLHIVVAEDHIEYHAPNGVNEHNHVMLDMIPGALGTPVEIDSLWEGEFEYTLGDTIYFPDSTFHIIKPENIKIIAFLQNHTWEGTTKEIYQGARVYLKDVMNDTVLVLHDRTEDESGDGKLSSNEKANVFVRVENKGEELTNVEILLSTTTPGIEVEKDRISVESIETGETYVNNDDPFVIRATNEYSGDPIELIFKLLADNYYAGEFIFTGVKEDLTTRMHTVEIVKNGFIHYLNVPKGPFWVYLYNTIGEKIGVWKYKDVEQFKKQFILPHSSGIYYIVIKTTTNKIVYKGKLISLK